MLKGITMVIPFFLLFPTDDYHAERLISTQRFSVGHFWSPYHTKNKGVFRKCFVTFQATISCKHPVSISYKIPHFHAISPFSTPIYNYTKTTALGTEREKRKFLSFFVFWRGEEHYVPEYNMSETYWKNYSSDIVGYDF
jgi:hypothetical protein